MISGASFEFRRNHDKIVNIFTNWTVESAARHAPSRSPDFSP